MTWSRLNAAWPGLILAACAAFAGSWPEADFRNWNKKQVQRILSNSPWVHRGYLRVPETDTSTIAPPPFDPTLTSDTGGGCGKCGSTPPSVHTLLPLSAFSVSWLSALPVRQALIRRQFGAEVPDDPGVAAYLEQHQPWYYIAVSGLPPNIVASNLQVLKRAAFLKAGDGAVIRAQEIEAGANRDSVTVFFSFPRAGEDGKPALRLKQKTVEILLDLGSHRIREEFKLKDMVYNGKLEL